MNATAARLLNPILGVFGVAVVPTYLGRWSVDGETIRRDLYQIGWRLGRRADAGEPMSELDRFCRDRTLAPPTADRHGMADKFLG